jgi:hypothetical protein
MQNDGHIDDHIKGAFATLWAWLRRGASKAAAEPALHETATLSAASGGSAPEPGIVLSFPLRGEALLVRLAELLRRRVAELVPQWERLALTLSHHPALRLTLDQSAFIEFDAPSGEFNLVIEAPSGTRMIIQTTDFDAVVKFVLQYVVEKLSDDAVLEAAS